MTALARAVQSGRIPSAEIVIVLSDKLDAAGIRSAEDAGLKTIVIEKRGRKRDEHEAEIRGVLADEEVDFVCLAGYMRLLSHDFIEAFPGRILNIHPSLLPAFPGLDAQRQALEHGVKVTGCTVHFVDDTLDGGPIIAQRVVPVLDEDTVDTLSARILAEEHQLYPQALQLVVSGAFVVEGRRVKRRDKIG
jgi:phosphoribosylglycinamide formyltransferase-1